MKYLNFFCQSRQSNIKAKFARNLWLFNTYLWRAMTLWVWEFIRNDWMTPGDRHGLWRTAFASSVSSRSDIAWPREIELCRASLPTWLAHPGLPKPLPCLSNCALLEGLAASGVTKLYWYCGSGNTMCDQQTSITVTTKPHLFGWSPESYCSPLLRLNQPWTPILSLWYLASSKPNLQNSKR